MVGKTVEQSRVSGYEDNQTVPSIRQERIADIKEFLRDRVDSVSEKFDDMRLNAQWAERPKLALMGDGMIITGLTLMGGGSIAAIPTTVVSALNGNFNPPTSIPLALSIEALCVVGGVVSGLMGTLLQAFS